jgi:hypothetical protein
MTFNPPMQRRKPLVENQSALRRLEKNLEVAENDKLEQPACDAI